MGIALLHPTYVCVRYFESSRKFCDDAFKRFNQNKILCNEIVTFDNGLFKMNEIKSPNVTLSSDACQIIAVVIRPTIEPVGYLEEQGFTFCGYDLVNNSIPISVITDCGASFNAIPYEKLTEYGLLPTYKDAVLTQLALIEEDPNDRIAYCDIYEIWRKIV